MWTYYVVLPPQLLIIIFSRKINQTLFDINQINVYYVHIKLLFTY